MDPVVDILIPTFERPAALAVTLTALMAQPDPPFRIVVSDQGDHLRAEDSPEVRGVVRVLHQRNVDVEVVDHRPRQGMAEHRQFLLDQARAPFALFLDDDILLEPGTLARLYSAIRHAGCGFIGSAPIGLSYAADVRPNEEWIELWNGPVVPEAVEPNGPAWPRHRVHNAANILHVQERLELPAGDDRLYRVAWVGGCVLYDTRILREAGGFSFWANLPAEHSGEDVLAQLRVMRRAGGAGLIPSGAYHLELPTTVEDRRVDAPHVLAV